MFVKVPFVYPATLTFFCLHTCLCLRFEMIDAARNKVRVKVCYVMMAATIGACLVMVIMGKRVSDNSWQLSVCMHCFSPVSVYRIRVEWFTTMWKRSLFSFACCFALKVNPSTLLYLYIMWRIRHFQLLPAICLVVSQAAGRHESLTKQNMEKKARWREELERDKLEREAVTLSEKAQW